MTTSRPSSPGTSRKLAALIFGANFFGVLIIFLYFSVIDLLPVGRGAVRSLETEDIVTFGIAGAVIFAGAFAMIGRLGRPFHRHRVGWLPQFLVQGLLASVHHYEGHFWLGSRVSSSPAHDAA